MANAHLALAEGVVARGCANRVSRQEPSGDCRDRSARGVRQCAVADSALADEKPPGLCACIAPHSAGPENL